VIRLRFIFSFSRLKVISLLFILLTQISCSYFQELKQKRDQAEADLDVICKNIPIPKTFNEVNSEKTLDIKKVVIFRKYKSNDPCKLSGEYFKNYFIEQGWNRDRMKATQQYGSMKLMDFEFRNADYVVSIECPNEGSDYDEKDILVACSWGLLPSD
jgi:hypothetical protein